MVLAWGWFIRRLQINIQSEKGSRDLSSTRSKFPLKTFGKYIWNNLHLNKGGNWQQLRQKAKVECDFLQFLLYNNKNRDFIRRSADFQKRV